jgi:glucose-6-phosphate 1-dehydrogenase
MSEHEKPITIVIFGASGDLTWRKLVPSLFSNYRKKCLPYCPHIVGFSRTHYSDQEFRQHLLTGVEEFTQGPFEPEQWEKFAEKPHYVIGDMNNPADFVRLDNRLKS